MRKKAKTHRKSKNSYKELGPTLTKKISKSLNKKLGLSFIYNDIYLKKEIIILIIKTKSKIYELKTYDKVIINPIYNIKWQ